jgi:restriction system protein
MARRRKSDLGTGIGGLVVLGSYFIYSGREEWIPRLQAYAPIVVVACVTIGILGFVLVQRIRSRMREQLEKSRHEEETRLWQERQRNFRLQAVNIANVDTLTGIAFEEFVGTLLYKMGYQVDFTPKVGDYGVDIIATKGDKKLAVQCKRYKSKVPIEAVYQVVGGIKHYGCNGGMVITNSVYTKNAIKLAESNGIKLIDREQLGKLIRKNQHLEVQREISSLPKVDKARV